MELARDMLPKELAEAIKEAAKLRENIKYNKSSINIAHLVDYNA